MQERKKKKTAQEKLFTAERNQEGQKKQKMLFRQNRGRRLGMRREKNGREFRSRGSYTRETQRSTVPGLLANAYACCWSPLGAWKKTSSGTWIVKGTWRPPYPLRMCPRSSGMPKAMDSTRSYISHVFFPVFQYTLWFNLLTRYCGKITITIINVKGRTIIKTYYNKSYSEVVNYLFWNSAFNIFGSSLITGNWSHRTWSHG